MGKKDQNPISTLSNSIKDFEALPQNGAYFEEDTESSQEEDSIDDHLKPSNIHVFSASSTLHGLSHIFASHHSGLRRFSWTAAFVASLSLFLIQVKGSSSIVFMLAHPL